MQEVSRTRLTVILVLFLALAGPSLAGPPSFQTPLTALGGVDRHLMPNLDNEALRAEHEPSATMRPGATMKAKPAAAERPL